ncbi:MAG: adenylyl-sulfate kinase [Candidatus Altiarchaeales archaeon]|nr:MAG: adenylyl-sulfate kinase [Candidatus Altiarchaeales archaeon]
MFVIWLTGPSGSGKTTLAKALKKKLEEMGYKTEILDGDEIRERLYPNIGFSNEAREMHNRIVIHMAKLLARNGIIAIVSLISPFRAVRNFARKEIGNFVEVYLRCPKEVRIRRDPKGLYAKAIRGEIKNLTGYDGIYEEPTNPEVVLDTDKLTIEEEVAKVINKLREMNFFQFQHM